MPRTYAQWLDLLAWWLEDGASEYETLSWSRGTGNWRESLVRTVTSELLQLLDSDADALPDALSRAQSVFERLDTLDAGRVDAANLQEGDAYERLYLFHAMADHLDATAQDGQTFVPMPLTVSGRMEGFVPVTMRVFFVGAASTHPDEAAAYLDAFVRGKGDAFRIAAFGGPHSAVPNPRYEQRLAEIQEEAAYLEAEIKKGQGGDVDELTSALNALTRRREQVEAAKWLIPQENIDRLERIAPTLTIARSSIMEATGSQSAVSVEGLMGQYVDGRIDAAAYIAQLTGLLELIRLEDGGEAH